MMEGFFSAEREGVGRGGGMGDARSDRESAEHGEDGEPGGDVPFSAEDGADMAIEHGLGCGEAGGAED